MLLSAFQVAGLLMFVAGLFILTGLGWSLLIVGALLVAATVRYEIVKEVEDARKTADS